MKPWEKYQTGESRNQAGPWEKYKAAPQQDAPQGAEAEAQPSPDVQPVAQQTALIGGQTGGGDMAARVSQKLKEKSGGTGLPVIDNLGNMLSVGTGLLEKGWDTAKSVVTGEGRREDYPEMPAGWDSAIHGARTPEGMLNIVRKYYPNAELTEDQYGNPMVIPNPQGKDEAILDNEGNLLGVRRQGKIYDPQGNVVAEDQGWTPEKDAAPMYLNKPGLSMNDITGLPSAVKRYSLPIVSSGVTAGAGPLLAMTSAGGSGVLNEFFAQAESEAKGADEGYSIPQMLKTGGFASLGEGGGRALAWGLGKVMGKFGWKGQISDLVDDAGRLSPKAVNILKQNKVSPDDLPVLVRRELAKAGDDILTPEQAARFNAFKGQGMSPTRAQVTGKFDDFQYQSEMAKDANLGGPIRQRLAEQNTKLGQNIDDVAARTNGTAGDKYTAGESVVDAVKGKSAEIDDVVSDLYKSARRGADISEPTVMPNAVLARLQQNARFNRVINGRVSSIKQGLVEKGIIDRNGRVLRRMSPEEVEITKREINDLWSPDKTVKKVLGDIKDALDDDLLRGAGRDVFRQGRAAKAQWHQEFNNPKNNKVVMDILDDKIPPDKLFDRVVLGKTVDDLKALKKTLTTGSQSQVQRGTQAWNDLRRQTLDHALDKATTGSRVNEAGERIISGVQFQKALDKIGRQKLNVLLDKSERDALRELVRVQEFTVPPQGSVNYSGTSSALINFVRNTLDKIPAGRAALGLSEVGKQAVKGAKDKVRIDALLNPEKATVKAITEGAKRTQRAASPVRRAGVPAAAAEDQRRR